MATFRFPDDFKEHKQYVILLKKALQFVKPGTEKKFLYFNQYPFGAKKFPLVLLDFDLNCKAVIVKAGHKVTAEGMLKLTEQDELNFEATIGSLKRIGIKRYFGTMGPGIKAVYVPLGEVDDEAEGAENSSQETAPVNRPLPPPPIGTVPADQPLPPPTTEPLPPLPQVPPPMGDAMKKKMEFEEKAFALRQRIDGLRGKPVPAPLEPVKAQTLTKAAELVAKGGFAEATQLLDLLAKRLAAPIAPSPMPPLPKTPTPKLSTYMNASRDWKTAKKTAGDGVFALKNAIFKACDKELEKAVKAKIDQLNGILAVMDDGIIKKIEDAGREPDAERQVERNQELAKFANNVLSALSNNPLAKVADNNAFGTFAIRSPVETVLTRIVTDFGG